MITATRADRGSWERWRIFWHAFFLLLLAYATVGAISYGSHSSARTALVLFLVAAMAAWYVSLVVIRPGAGRQQVVYAVGAVALWAALVALDPEFLILGLGVFAPLCIQNFRWGFAVIVVVGGGWVVQRWVAQGGVPWPEVAGVLVGGAGVVLSIAYVGTIVRQSEERRRLIEELRETRAGLAAAERQSGILEERQRLARDIHDTLTQGFTSIVMLLEAAEEVLGPRAPGAGHVDKALRSARENLVESRRLVWALRPGALEETSLPAAVERLARTISEETGVRAETVLTGGPRPIPVEHEAALLRTAQEALANVRKHARATTVTVTLSYMDDGTLLDVQDDGIGLDPSPPPGQVRGGGLGLRSMRERIQALGGTVSLESAPGEGTTVAVNLPVGSADPPRPAAPAARW